MSDQKEKTVEMKDLDGKKEQGVGVASAIDTNTGLTGEEEKASGKDVKDVLKTVAQVIRQHTDLTEVQAGQLEEMLIDGFTDTNGVIAKQAAYETLVAVINEPKYKNWKDAGEGSLDMYQPLSHDCWRKARDWRKEQRLAQAELNRETELREKTQGGLIVDLSARLVAQSKALVINKKSTESLQIDLDASEAPKAALSERVAEKNKEEKMTKIKMEGLQMQVSKYKASAVVNDDGEVVQSAVSKAEIEGMNEKVLESVHHMINEVYGRLNQVEERQEKLGGDIVGSLTQLLSTEAAAQSLRIEQIMNVVVSRDREDCSAPKGVTPTQQPPAMSKLDEAMKKAEEEERELLMWNTKKVLQVMVMVKERQRIWSTHRFFGLLKEHTKLSVLDEMTKAVTGKVKSKYSNAELTDKVGTWVEHDESHGEPDCSLGLTVTSEITFDEDCNPIVPPPAKPLYEKKKKKKEQRRAVISMRRGQVQSRQTW
jgi:hypothetical protein